MKVGRFFLSVVESRFFITWITVLGILLRVALIYYTGEHSTNTFKDEDDYQSLGDSLSHGGPYSIDGIHLSAFRPPAEAGLIAIVFRLFGPHLLYVKLVEALLLAIVPYACSRLGRSLGLSVAAANVGAALAGLHPGLAYASTTIYPTVLTAAALATGILFSIYILKGKGVVLESKGTVLKGKGTVFESRGTAAAAGAGLAFGLAASATTTFAPVALLAGLIMAVRRRYSAALIVAVLGTLPVLAWMIRNEIELGEFTVATNGSINFFLGANDYATPMSGNNLPMSVLYPLPQFEEVKLDRIYKVEATDWIKAHPGRWGKLVILRGVLVFDSVGNAATQGLHSGVAAHLVGWTMLPVIVLSLIGLFSSYRLPLAWLTMAIISPVILSSALSMPKPRFRFPCDPALSVFSVVGFMALWNKSRNVQVSSSQIASSPRGPIV